MKKAETKKVTTSKEVKAPVASKNTAGKKSAAPKKAVKSTAKTATAKKGPVAKKATAKSALHAKVVLQYGEISLDQDTLMTNVQNFLQYDRNMALADQVGVEIYVKPEEGKAYIVVNGVEEGSMLL